MRMFFFSGVEVDRGSVPEKLDAAQYVWVENEGEMDFLREYARLNNIPVMVPPDTECPMMVEYNTTGKYVCCLPLNEAYKAVFLGNSDRL